ncbi:MAG: hypothetical protein JOZ49_00645, partial [Mycolicibacterium sp.]|nr:hypothetical protein [Mycolicibacterium sp.]
MTVPDVPAPPAALLVADSQRGFPWSRDKWAEQMYDLPDVLHVLKSVPDRIDRDTVRKLVAAE